MSFTDFSDEYESSDYDGTWSARLTPQYQYTTSGYEVNQNAYPTEASTPFYLHSDTPSPPQFQFSALDASPYPMSMAMDTGSSGSDQETTSERRSRGRPKAKKVKDEKGAARADSYRKKKKENMENELEKKKRLEAELETVQKKYFEMKRLNDEAERLMHESIMELSSRTLVFDEKY